MSAVRNLAGRELNGRPLRIDSASNAPSAGGVGGMGMGFEGPKGSPGPGSGPGPGPGPGQGQGSRAIEVWHGVGYG